MNIMRKLLLALGILVWLASLGIAYAVGETGGIGHWNRWEDIRYFADPTVAKSTKITNLNADLLDGYDSLYFGTASDVTALISSMATVEVSIATIELDIVTLESSMSTAESNISALQSSMSTVEADISTLQSSMVTVEASIVTIQASVDTFGSLAADETLSGDWDNTANPWADNEVAPGLTIDEGIINDTPIGASTPSTGVFTTLDAATLDTASLVASSDTKVTSFNADLLDGYDWDDGQDVVFGSTQAAYIPVLTKTATYTVTTADFGKSIRMNSGGTVTFSLPSVGAAEDGALLRFVKCGAGKLILGAADSDKIANSGAGGTIYNDVADQTYADISLEYVHLIVTWIIPGALGTWITTN